MSFYKDSDSNANEDFISEHPVFLLNQEHVLQFSDNDMRLLKHRH